MAINCSSNAALDKLQASKDALNAQLDAAVAGGRAKLAAVKAAAEQLEADLLAAIPELPELPNFKKELEELKGKVGEELAKAKAAFKARWGDSLPDIDIDDLMNKVSSAIEFVENFEENLEDLVTGAVGLAVDKATDLASGVADKFDFCKDVPNVEGTVDPATGNIATVKDKGAEPTPAQEPAKIVEPVVPTVINASKAPSKSGNTTRSFDEIKESKKPYDDEIAEWHTENNRIFKPEFKKQKELTSSRAFKKMMKKYNKAVEKGEIKYGSDYYNTIASESDKELLQEYFIIRSIVQLTALEAKMFNRINQALRETTITGNPIRYSIGEVKNYYVGTAVSGTEGPEGSLPDIPARVPDLEGSSYYQTIVNGGKAERYKVGIDVPMVYKRSYPIFKTHQKVLQELAQYLYGLEPR
jgi:hypothetical protein